MGSPVSQSFEVDRADLSQSIRLEASAGTGKTYALERIVCRLIADYALPIEKILVVTFTNRAARELKERIRSLLSQRARETKGLEEKGYYLKAKAHFDRASIFTIHGFCRQVLQAYPFESASLFQQEFLEDNTLTGEALDEVLLQAFLKIPEEEREAVRAFFNKGLRGGRDSLLHLLEKGFPEEDTTLLPSEEMLAKAREESLSYQKGGGAIREALERMASLRPEGDEINGIFKTLRTGQKSSTAEKVARAWEALEKESGSLGEWFQRAFNKGEDGIPWESLYLISRNSLKGKAKEDLSALGERANQIVGAVTSLAKAIAPFGDPQNPLRNYYLKILGYSYFRPLLSKAQTLVEEKKQLRGARDFDDLINVLAGLLKKEPQGPLAQALRQDYQTLLVDEFQDTDSRQWSIFQTLFDAPGHNYFLIGDPKQSIYGFRGADLSVYFSACARIPQENHYSLRTNYRSGKALVEGCNSIFAPLFRLPSEGSNPIPFEAVTSGKKDISILQRDSPFPPAPISFLEIRDENNGSSKALHRAWLRRIVGEVKALLGGAVKEKEGTAFQPRDIAILLEKNRDCEVIQNLLEREGVPGVIFSQRRVMDSEEAQTFGFLLQCLKDPLDKGAASALLLSPLFELSPRAVKDFFGQPEADRLFLFLREQQELCNRRGIIQVFHRLFEDELPLPWMAGRDSWRNRLLLRKGGKRSCTNLIHLAEIFHKEQWERGLDSQGLWELYSQRKTNPQGDEETLVRLDQDGQAVQILTHHRSKGLEFPVVFFVGGTSGFQPPSPLEYQWKGQKYRDYLVSEEGKKRSRLGDWEERKRLYYVAFTRASLLLYLPWFPQMGLCPLTSLYASLVNLKPPPPLEGEGLEGFWPLHLKDSVLGTKKKGELAEGINQSIEKGLKELVAQRPRIFAYNTEPLPLPPLGLQESPPPGSLSLPPWKSSDLFSTRIFPVTSFSTLTSRTDHKEESRTDADRDPQISGLSRGGLPPPLAIPGGTDFGNLVHAIFENIDFRKGQQPLQEWLAPGSETLELIQGQTLLYFGPPWWRDYGKTLCEMIHSVLNCPLPIGPLKELSPEVCKTELEFLISLPGTQKIRVGSDFRELEKGFLKGFIDLLFYKEGKYYIADWKTTVPPGKGEWQDYEEANLERTMVEHHYDLQASIYARAFGHYMKSMDPNFSYQRQFGGIYYFFVRAMGQSLGVHFSRPKEAELQELFTEKGRVEEEGPNEPLSPV